MIALRLAFALVCGLLALAVAEPVGAQLVRSRPPPGFDDVRAPQPAVVDIWFEGARLGTANVLLAPGKIRFDDPRAVAELLPGAIDVDAVAAALSGALATNAERRCEPGAPPDCGLLAPDVAGVIADAATFRVDVFVGEAHRGRADPQPRFVPRPAWSPSAVQGFALTASAVPGDDLRAVLAARSVLATGPARIVGDYGLDLDDGVYVEALAGQLEHRRWRVEAGLARSNPVPLLADRRYLGGRIATTLDTRLDRDAVRAQPLLVSLARRAQVEILRDGRLLSVQTLPAGTAALDTRPLPVGAYDVTLRIVSAGGVREERRFFVKSLDLPPTDAPSFVIEAGVFAEEASDLPPELGDTPFVHGGLRYRLSSWFGAGPDVALTPREAVLSLRAAALRPGIEATADIFAGSDGAAGVGFAARGRVGRVGYTLGARRIVGQPGPGTIDTRDPNDDTPDRFVPGRELERITAFAENSTQLDLSLGYYPGTGPRLGLRGFWRRDEGVGETYAIGPNLSWPIARAGPVRLDLFAEAAATDRDAFVFARLRVSFDAAPWRLWAEGGYRVEDHAGSGSGAVGAISVARDLVRNDDHRLALAGRVDREPGITEVLGEVDYDGTPGRFQLTAAHETGAGDTRFAATAATTLAVGSSGVGLVGRRSEASALVARIDGEGAAGAAEAAVFELVVDDRARRRLRPGRQATVPLAPYDAYRVRLRQVAGPIASYDGRTRNVSVYPGTVATERWLIHPLVTVFGRLTDRAGRPLGDAALDTQPPVFTDAGGYFQAELGAGRPTVTAGVGGGVCRLELPDLAPTTGYHRLGDVRCVPASP